MIAKIIEYSARNKFIVFMLIASLAIWGYWALMRTPLDAIPDLSDTQVIIYTEWAGRSPDLPDVPAFLEAYREVWGKDATPSGDKWLALQMLTRIMDSLYRTVFMPPNAPAAAVAEMRSAMTRLEKDAEFVADYEKVVKTKPRFILGAEGERIIAELGNVQPSFLGFLREYIKMGK